MISSCINLYCILPYYIILYAYDISIDHVRASAANLPDPAPPFLLRGRVKASNHLRGVQNFSWIFSPFWLKMLKSPPPKKKKNDEQRPKDPSKNEGPRFFPRVSLPLRHLFLKVQGQGLQVLRRLLIQSPAWGHATVRRFEAIGGILYVSKAINKLINKKKHNKLVRSCKYPGQTNLAAERVVERTALRQECIRRVVENHHPMSRVEHHVLYNHQHPPASQRNPRF